MYDGSTTGCRMRRWVGHRFLLSTFLMAMAAGCTAVPDDATQPGEAAAALPFEGKL